MIPQDIVSGILRDVPVKSLLRFKCVSKEWYSIINHPYFINLHLHQSIKTDRHDLRVVVTERSIGTSKLLCLDSNSGNLDNPRILSHPLKLPREDDYDGHNNIVLIGSCNGLVCLMNERSRETALWNISTGEYRVVPEFPVERTKVLSHVYGMGHDSINDDYKLVMIAIMNVCPIVNETVVYSLRTNTWRWGEEISDDSGFVPIFNRSGTFVHGALHWVSAGVSEYPNKRSIAAFDVGIEKYRRIELPDNIGCNCLVLGALGGCLCATESSSDCKVDVWSMKDYGVKDSWTMLFSLRTGNIPWYSLRPLAYSKTRDKLLLESMFGNVIWHHLKDDELNTYMQLGEEFHSTEIYMESLVQL